MCPAADEVHGRGKILVVEDNPDVAEVTEDMCRDLGYDVQGARTAKEAYRLIESEPFDLVISDIVMPGEMDGVELARRIRDSYPEIPVLLVTGFSDKATGIVPEFPLLRKPFEIAELSRLAARMVAAAKASGGNVVKLRRRPS